jgi:hypothetical protein
MFQCMYNHDLLKAEIGDEYEPLETAITEEIAGIYLFANDDYHPWYMEDSPFGGRIVPLNLLIKQAIQQFYLYYATPSGGTLHAKHGAEFINPLKLGKNFRMTGSLVDRYSRKGRDFFVSEFLAVDEDGTEIARIKTIEASPAVVRPEG